MAFIGFAAEIRSAALLERMAVCKVGRVRCGAIYCWSAMVPLRVVNVAQLMPLAHPLSVAGACSSYPAAVWCLGKQGGES